ncbi:MAG: cbb3-type cytochrome c oxidase subunit II, partial [Phycisphaeraceae bacterium]
AEGCYNCHSQMIRPILAEVQRYGDYSKPGESVYDHPHQWGSRRIGPDLAREGGKQSDLWHYLHFQKPGEMVPGSIMPPYAWLEKKELDFESIPVRVNAIKLLHPGDKHWDSYAFNDNKAYPLGDASVEHAEAQALAVAQRIEEQGGPPAEQLADKQVVAIIAYLQRLGTDLTREPAVDVEPVEESAPAEAAAPTTPAPTLGSVNGGR